MSRNLIARPTVHANLGRRQVDVLKDVGRYYFPQLLVDGVFPSLRRYERQVDDLVENFPSGLFEQLVTVKLAKSK